MSLPALRPEFRFPKGAGKSFAILRCHADAAPQIGAAINSKEDEMRKLVLAAIISALVAVAFASAAMAQGSGGVSGPSFYVDGQLYRTVGTPTDLSTTGAPDQSFDTIYQFF